MHLPQVSSLPFNGMQTTHKRVFSVTLVCSYSCDFDLDLTTLTYKHDIDILHAQQKLTF